MKSKIALCLAIMFSFTVAAQEAISYLRGAEEKSYNPKMKGLEDLVVDLINPQLTKELNEQMIFGRVNEVIFRLYWTAKPERVAIEVLGLPEGFREIKEELKAAMLGRLESVIPLALEKKFEGYQFRLASGKQRTVIGTAQSGMQPIPEFEIQFDEEGKLMTLVAKKPIGHMTSQFSWSKTAWSQPRSAISRVTTRSEDGPQLSEIDSETTWQVVAGIGVPAVVKTRTKQTLRMAGSSEKPLERVVEETMLYKNYKINAGEAMKWFLGNNTPVGQ